MSEKPSVVGASGGPARRAGHRRLAGHDLGEGRRLAAIGAWIGVEDEAGTALRRAFGG